MATNSFLLIWSFIVNYSSEWFFGINLRYFFPYDDIEHFLWFCTCIVSYFSIDKCVLYLPDWFFRHVHSNPCIIQGKFAMPKNGKKSPTASAQRIPNARDNPFREFSKIKSFTVIPKISFNFFYIFTKWLNIQPVSGDTMNKIK